MIDLKFARLGRPEKSMSKFPKDKNGVPQLPPFLEIDLLAEFGERREPDEIEELIAEAEEAMRRLTEE